MKKILLITLFASLLIGCMPATRDIQRDEMNEIVQEVQQRNVYIPVNDIEFKNYNAKQLIADDPTTILWCTFFPITVGQEPFTVPIVGKLTSSGKRPFPKEQRWMGSGTARYYNPEVVQPDKMYGSSTEYRYGFTPAGFYIDFTDLHSFCTNQPTTWQRNQTTLVMKPDTDFLELQSEAKKALEDGDNDLALELLSGLEWREEK